MMKLQLFAVCYNLHSSTNLSDPVIFLGALDLRSKTVKFVQTPLNEVFMLSLDHPMNRETMETIVNNGYSRIPIYRTHREVCQDS